MKKILLTNKGFTLVEILVAVGVLSVASLAFIPSFSKSNQERNLEQNSENVKDALATARNRALTNTGDSYSYSGVKFEDMQGTYRLFRSTTATSQVCNNLGDPGSVVDSTRNTTGDVFLRIPSVEDPIEPGDQDEDPTCIFFEYGSGEALVTKGGTTTTTTPTYACGN